jgi:dihydroflavonol-4-reductase
MPLAVITGASGLVGGNLAEALLQQGHRVRATRRASTRVDHLDDLAIEWADADLGQPRRLADAFAGADVVFHCAAHVTTRRGVSSEMTAANVTGTAHVLEAARAARVPRLVHTSTVAAVGLSVDGAPCTEEATWNFDQAGLLDGYAITKRRSEELVREAAEGGLDAVIVNPTYMFGPRDARPSSGRLIVDVVHRRVPGWTTGLNNFVDVRDVARGMIAAWQRGRRGERYILGGHNMTYRDIMHTIAGVAGVRPPRLRVPRLLARAMGAAGDVSERLRAGGGRSFINSVVVRYAYTTRFQFASDKAMATLDYRFGPVETAIRDALTWFRGRGMLS